MTDGEPRGLLLEKYYLRRRGRVGGLALSDFDGELNEHDILNIAGQLADHGLIHWRANRGQGGVGGGMGTITGAGGQADAGRWPAPVEIRFSRDRNLLGPVSPQATAPDHTRQSVAVAIERLAQAIDDADASAANKRAATLL